MLAAGFGADWRHSDAHREASRRKALAGRSGADLWIFAYGSLVWDPAIRFSELRAALLAGYRRRFCLRSVLGRGTPEAPGLMAGLDTGGECHGLAFKIESDAVDEESRILWRREMVMPAYQPKFVEVETERGCVEALAFVVDHAADNYIANLTLDETVRMIVTGKGLLGTSLSYVESLAEHFAVMGIEDADLSEIMARCRQAAP